MKLARASRTNFTSGQAPVYRAICTGGVWDARPAGSGRERPC